MQLVRLQRLSEGTQISLSWADHLIKELGVYDDVTIIGIASILLRIILVSIGFGFIWLFYRMYLLTVIKEDGIQIKFFPFTDFIIPFNKIKNYKIKKYRPITEYEGWGIRFNKSGKAYTVSGKIGLQIELSNGKSILIGTQKSDALLQSVNKTFK